MQKTIQFDAEELFDSLPGDRQEVVTRAISDAAENRDKERYRRLQALETAKNELIQELKDLEYAIAENDEWFIEAKEGKVDANSAALATHRTTAAELYSRKKIIIDGALPGQEEAIASLVSQIEIEEQQEGWLKQRHLETLLLPIYEANERDRREAGIAAAGARNHQRREQEAKWREQEARRQQQHKFVLKRMHEKQLEKIRHLAEERQSERVENIRAQVEARHIPFLVHFTPLSNVASILEHGLRSRSALDGQDFVFTDQYRSDGWLDWISTSICFPNYKMFYAKKNSMRVGPWAILLIKKQVLWELDCKFILTNAASYEIKLFRNDRWSSVDAFEDMFGQPEHRIAIPDSYPTDPQAEVMIRNKVPRSYIGGILVEREEDRKILSQSEDVRVEKVSSLFKPRIDFEHWRNRRLSPFPVDKTTVVSS